MKSTRFILPFFVLFLSTVYIKSQAQTMPTIGSISTTKVNIGSGLNYLIISNITDGDVGVDQTVTLTVTSSNTSVLEIVNLEYNAQGHYAVLSVLEKNTNGQSRIDIIAQDVDGLNSRSYFVDVSQFLRRGVRFSVHDIVFWQRIVPLGQRGLLDSIIPNVMLPTDQSIYNRLPLTVGPSAGWPKHDFFTTLYEGFLQVTATGVYTLSAVMQDQCSFYLSNTSNPNQAIQIIHSPDGGPRSANVTLTGGNIYAFYGAYWAIHAENFRINISAPGFSNRLLGGDMVFPFYDLVKPSISGTTMLAYRGVNDASIRWRKGRDNSELVGYYIYLNGVKHDSVLSANDTTYMLRGLQPNTRYGVFVRAIDKVRNESFPNTPVIFNTYPVDNTLPTPPTQIQVTKLSDLAVEITWSGATDIGSEIFGYDVYLNDVLYNTTSTGGRITTTVTALKILTPQTTYTVKIKSVDGGGNVSVFSNPISFTTLKFEPLNEAPGIKKSRVNIFRESIGRNEGIGVNGSYTSATHYTGVERTLINDMKPSILRWGALDANPMNFSAYSGNSGYTYAKFMNLCADVNAYAAITVGVKDGTDWRGNMSTFTRFMEYIGGPTNTSGGAIRSAEGITTPPLSRVKGLLIELGNEVWGAGAHNAEIGSNYVNYGAWCRSVAGVIKSSPYYDSTKVFIIYSGRYPDPEASYGLHNLLLSNADRSIDWIALSGYLGGNLNYDPAIPMGESELDYYKDGFVRMAKNINGFRLNFTNFHGLTGGASFKTYLYESNMTTPAYNGRLGQAVIMSDYFLSVNKFGSVLPTIFHLTGGEWRITEPAESHRRLPLFEFSKLINWYTKGNVLRTTIDTKEVLRGANNSPLTGFEPVGVHVMHENGSYKVVCISRDFEHDHQVQLNFENGIIPANTARKYELTGTDFNTRFTNIDSSTVEMKDSLVVTVPKYGMVIYVFDGTNLHQPRRPLGYTRLMKIQNIRIIVPAEGKDITENFDSRLFTYSINPSNATFKSAKWTVTRIPDTLDVVVNIDNDNKLGIFGASNCRGNGKLHIRVEAEDDSTIFDEIEMEISGQIDDGAESCLVDEGDSTVSVKQMKKYDLYLHPNPATDKLFVHFNSETPLSGKINIVDAIGKLVLDEQVSEKRGFAIDIQSLKSGIYTVQWQNVNGQTSIRRFSKQ